MADRPSASRRTSQVTVFQAVDFSVLVTSLSPKLLTPWSRVLLEKLIVTQLVSKVPASYGNLKFITVFTQALL
jgi:hypothetical protein